MPTLPTNRTTSNTAAEHVSDHNALHTFYNALNGTSVFSDYTPALTATTTNPTLGTGSTAVGRYKQNGKDVSGWATIKFGSGGSAGSGTYEISLPVAPKTEAVERIIGSGVYWQTGSSVPLMTVTIAASGTKMRLRAGGAALTESGWLAAGSQSEIYLSFAYEAA